MTECSIRLAVACGRKQIPLNGGNRSTCTAIVPVAIDIGGSNQRRLTYDGIGATNTLNQAQESFVRLAIPTHAGVSHRYHALHCRE